MIENRKSGSPAVSVIIPCFNAGKYLSDTVESVLAQSFKDYEIIIVDDGSSDNTRLIIKSFGFKVRAEYLKHTGLVSAARNFGTQKALGDFIQYLDADDLLRPDAIEKRIKVLLETDGDVAYSDWQKLEETDDGNFKAGEIIARIIEDIHPDPEIALLTGFWAPPAALLYRRRIVSAIGSWNESLPVVEDARFLLDAALHGARFVHTPGTGADYRILKTASLSRRDPKLFAECCLLNASQIEVWWGSHGGLTAARRFALAQVYDYTARSLFHLDFQLFKKILSYLYRVEPEFRFSWPKIAGILSILLGQRIAVLLLRLIGKPGTT